MQKLELCSTATVNKAETGEKETLYGNTKGNY